MFSSARRLPVRSQALFVDVLHAFWKSRKSLVVARVQGVPQFPVILRREFLSNLSPDAGDLLSLCQHHKDELQLVDGIVENGELAG